MPPDGSSLSDVRAAYDAVAAAYADKFLDELEGKPLDRALLAWFAELVRGAGPVADLGTGPGHVARALHEGGAEVFGIDLSPTTVALARERHRDLGIEFRTGDFFALDLPDGALAGATGFYAHVHVPAARLPAAFGELARVLRTGAPALVAFHLGDESLRVEDWLGAQVGLEWNFFPMRVVTGALEAAGLAVEVKIERAPYAQEYRTSRGYVLARRR